MTEPVTQETPQTPALGLADLKNVLIIIDLASSRGAFKTQEFAAVGSVYSKVAAFLEAAQPAAAPTDETTEDTADSSADSAE